MAPSAIDSVAPTLAPSSEPTYQDSQCVRPSLPDDTDTQDLDVVRSTYDIVGVTADLFEAGWCAFERALVRVEEDNDIIFSSLYIDILNVTDTSSIVTNSATGETASGVTVEVESYFENIESRNAARDEGDVDSEDNRIEATSWAEWIRHFENDVSAGALEQSMRQYATHADMQNATVHYWKIWLVDDVTDATDDQSRTVSNSASEEGSRITGMGVGVGFVAVLTFFFVFYGPSKQNIVKKLKEKLRKGARSPPSRGLSRTDSRP